MPEAKAKIIAGEKFEVSQPYEEGHTLSIIEAKVLNQVRSENIANNMRAAVKEAIFDGTLPAFKKDLAAYDAAYEFSTPSSGGGRTTMDPVEREARKLAREAIKNKLAAEGRKIGEVDKEKLAEVVEQVAMNEEILKAAKKIVNDRQKLADLSVGDLNI